MEVRLFDRTTRSTTLSQAGEEFLPNARHLLIDLGRAIESVRDLERVTRGTVRIAWTPLYAATFLPRVVRSFRESHPGVTVYVLDSLHEEAMNRVLSGAADLGVAPQRKTSLLLDQEFVLKDRMWMVCRADHALARRKSVEWKQLLREPFISLTQDFTLQLQSDLLRHDPSLLLEPAHSVSLITTALGMVESGYGLTVQPERALPLLAPFGLVATKVQGPIVYRHLSLFRRQGRAVSPAATAFAEHLRSLAAKTGNVAG